MSSAPEVRAIHRGFSAFPAYARARSLRGAVAVALAAAACLGACTASNPARDAAVEAGDGAAPLDEGAVTDVLAPTTDAARPAPWPHELPPANVMHRERGFRAARAIVHAHSVHSHDACDGAPYVDGGVNEPCLQDFRMGLCRTRTDVVFLTEHAGHMAEGSFERVMQLRAGDEPIRVEGGLAGYRFSCADGHRVLVLPGAENELMPLALTRHPDPPPGGDLDDAYHQEGPEGAARMRAAGALVAVAHVEQRELAYLRTLRPDVVEIYNVHANLDPRIAGPNLGIDVGEFLLDITRFGSMTSPLESDLAFIAFFRENGNDLRKWATLTAEGIRVPGVAAADAHENTFRMPMNDGERGDSYRRIFRFFSNELLVPDDGMPLTREAALDALRASRVFVAFEAWGTPHGWRYVAERAGAVVGDVGSEVALEGGPLTLRVSKPHIEGFAPGLPAPVVRVRILRSDGTDWREVASGDEDTLAFTPTMPGVYRAEARITPNHALPYLPRFERLVRDMPWVYSSPIYVR